jgi:hypothetical protein
MSAAPVEPKAANGKKKSTAVTIKMSWGEVMILVIKFAVCSFVVSLAVYLVATLAFSLLGLVTYGMISLGR